MEVNSTQKNPDTTEFIKNLNKLAEVSKSLETRFANIEWAILPKRTDSISGDAGSAYTIGPDSDPLAVCATIADGVGGNKTKIYLHPEQGPGHLVKADGVSSRLLIQSWESVCKALTTGDILALNSGNLDSATPVISHIQSRTYQAFLDSRYNSVISLPPTAVSPKLDTAGMNLIATQDYVHIVSVRDMMACDGDGNILIPPHNFIDKLYYETMKEVITNGFTSSAIDSFKPHLFDSHFTPTSI